MMPRYLLMFLLYNIPVFYLEATELIAPIPVSPSAQQTFNKTPKTYIWKKVSGALRYDFYLYDRSTHSIAYRDQNISQCITKQCSFTLPEIIKVNDGKEHVWRVRAITSTGTTTFSYTLFSVNKVLNTPVIISPQDNAEIPFINKPIVFSWQKDDISTHYDFYIYDRNLQKTIYRNRLISPQCDFQNICVFTPPQNIVVSIGEEHVWRVRAINANENTNSKWSYSLFEVKRNNSLSNIKNYLSTPLWNKKNAYDVGHHGMLPLHASFTLDEYKNLRAPFQSQFSSFLSANGKDELEILGNLAAYQYYYLMSQYLVLSEKSNQPEDKLNNSQIKKTLCNKISSYWLHEPAWQYGAAPFTNMRERIAWKLQASEESIAFPFYRGIFDEELFFFAISHDLKQVDSYDACPVIDEILESTYNVIGQRSETTLVGGWLFDSVWGEHPYNKYAGYLDINSVINEQPSIISSLSWDSSHFHRFPLWLQSFRDAYPEGSEKYIFYQSIIDKLALQFKTKVMTQSGNNWFFTNYMDGWNGVFRYSSVNGEAKGYNPYELSATPLLGWWLFLNDHDINSTYCLISNNFPLSNSTLKTYVGLNSSRKRNPIVELPNSLYQGEILQTITQQACHIGLINEK